MLNKEDAREAFIKRLNIYWNLPHPPRFITRVGEIYEIDFGENVGDEFSGRHLGVCLEDTSASQSKVLVIPLTSKYVEYNIHEDDVIRTMSTYDKRPIVAGAVLGEARRISKFRVFVRSLILEEPPETKLNRAKGFIDIDKRKLKRWKSL